MQTTTRRILVPKLGTTFSPATTRMYDFTTNLLNIPDGGLGVFIPVAQSGNGIVPTLATPGQNIKFIQNRDTTRDSTSLGQRHFEETDWISAKCLDGTYITGEGVRNPSNNAWLLGPSALTPTVGQLVPQSELNYHLRVSSQGNRIEIAHGRRSTPTVNDFYVSPDFTSAPFAALTTAQQRDMIIQNMVYEHNKRNDVTNYSVAMCLTAANVAGGILVSTLATVAIGTVIIIGYRKNGMQVTLTIDKSIRQAIINAGTAISTLYIQPYHLTGTTNPPTAPVTGTTANCDRILFLALDEAKALYDYRPNVKTTITIGQSTGFELVNKQVLSTADEGAGQAHQVGILLQEEYYQANEQGKPHFAGYVNFPNEFKEDATYDIFSIRYCTHTTAQNGAPNQIQKEATFCILNTQDPTTPYFTGAVNPQKTYVQTVLNGFNTQNSLGNPTLAI